MKKKKEKTAASPFVNAGGEKNLGATIGREILCLPYVGFKKMKTILVQKWKANKPD